MKNQLNKLLSKSLLNSPLALSAWLGGSTATNREDHLSDSDLVIISDKPNETFYLIEEVLSSYSDITGKWVVEDNIKRHQRFYILNGSSDTYYVDIVIYDDRNPDHYREYFNKDRHGTPQILFDKIGILKIASQSPKTEDLSKLNWDNFQGKFEIIFRTFLKEAIRGKYIDAYNFYLNLVTLYIQIERRNFCSQKHDFNFRYIYIDLPQENSLFIEYLLKVSDLEMMKKNAITLKNKVMSYQMEIL